MFKLLTDTARKEIVEEYSTRRLILGMSGICIILGIGIIALLPSYIISKSKLNEIQINIDALEKQKSTQDSHELVLWLDGLTQEIKSLTPTMNEVQPYELFTNVINIKPVGISIKGFSLKKDGKTKTVSISGIAQSRKDLYDFEKILNNSGNFSEVVLPVSNFTKNSDIDFQLNVIPK